MSNAKDQKRYEDPELEKFFRENREIVEKLLKEERNLIKETVKAERERFEEYVGDPKVKVKETANDIFGAFTDPEVQRHFLTVGIELLLGVNALIQAAPIPEEFKDFVKKTEQEGKKAAGAAKKATSDVKKPGSVSVEKVNIKGTPRKKSVNE
ncbi:MAG: hypothetical protein LBM39_02810 [Candidatus Methanoplasma sp.]|jgi:hypothetical protein|nr:hypothetical protein [Candidatus Methanoplasma sp.]